MKETQSILNGDVVLDKKMLRLQKQIATRFWFGWAGGYLSSPKK